jgi:hypothetical protein
MSFDMKFNNFPLAYSSVHVEVLRVIKETIFEIEGIAKTESAVDKGAQRASIYTILPGAHDTYDEAVASALERNPKAKIVDKLEPVLYLSAIVGVGVDYAIYNELLGKAFLGPAADAVMPKFPARLNEAIEIGLRRISR